MEGRLQALYPSFKLPRRGHFFAARSAKKRRLFLAPATGCSLLSSGRLVSCSSVEFPDLPGGTGQVGVIQPGRHIVFFGLCEESAEPQRLFEERQGEVER